jgi:hypothetical protein
MGHGLSWPVCFLGREPTVPESIENLVQWGRLAGYQAPDLAEAVSLSLDLLIRLHERAITPGTIPPTLIERLASALQVAPEAVRAYLARPRSAPQFLCGGSSQRSLSQQLFLAAVHGSPMLSAARKQEWQAIAIEEGGETDPALL